MLSFFDNFNTYHFKQFVVFQVVNNMPGGLVNVDPQDPSVVLAANVALKAYNHQLSSATRKYHLLAITKAQQQVVAGTNTIIKFVAATRGVLEAPTEYVTCLAEVWEKVTLELSVTKVDCKPIDTA